jgi:hypothetical protein
MELPRFPEGMSTPFQFLDGVLPKLRVANVDAIKFEVLQVCQDLCRRGGVWRQWLGPVSVTGQYIEIPIPPPDPGVSVHTAYAVRLGIPNGPYLNRIDITRRSSRRSGGRGQPTAYVQTAPGLIQLDAMPQYPDDAPINLEGLFSLVPTDLCMPDWFVDEHFDTVVAGTLARLLCVKGPNYDAVMAMFHRKTYSGRVAGHRISAMSGFSTTSRKAEPGYYFASGMRR